MAKSKLVKANKKIENAVVGGFEKIKNKVVGGYTSIEDKFVDQYLTKDGETVDEAKKRLNGESLDLLTGKTVRNKMEDGLRQCFDEEYGSDQDNV
ncbi:MAG: hypothetical protein Q4D04_05145 [Clostridia bacterium]|nr:hypothetical protein [Clostridia bacterium]